MRNISLTRGRVALVDDQDFEFLSGFRWWARPHRNTWYAVTSIHDPERYAVGLNGTVNVCMHHMVLLGAFRLDHKDRNGLNNQFENLRSATLTQNQGNRAPNKRAVCPFKGVGWHKQTGCWRAFITQHGSYKHLGLFKSAEQAARAYDREAQHYFGEFANVNFPV